jgi:membrane protein
MVVPVRRRLEGSWAQAFAARLRAVDVVNSVTLFGAALLLSALPLVILLSSLANQRIDDDLSRHLGLDRHGAQIVRALFRHAPAHAAVPIVTGLLFSFAGTLAVVSCLQEIYERAFGETHRGWRDFPRFVVWVAVLLAALTVEGFADGPIRRNAGALVLGLIRLVTVTIFFAWTMHFLLAGRTAWQRVVRPALATAVLWEGLALFSAAYFSSAIVSDSRLYGTIGVVFSLLTWFIAIGAVVVLGAVGGLVWEERRGRTGPGEG